MIDDSWDKLLTLKTKLLLSRDRAAALHHFLDEDIVIEVDADDVEQAMFLAAANRMADLLGIACFRMDVEGGKPQMVFSFGMTVEDAKIRMQRFYEARQQEIDLGIDAVD